MDALDSLIEISEYKEIGYRTLVAFDGWRVAILNYIDELLPENLYRMQKHTQTDEVFVLLSGRCILFLMDAAGECPAVHAVDMQPFKLYNVKQGAWHTHTLSQDASVLIIENRDTADENSPFQMLSAEQRKKIVNLTRDLWKE